MKHLSKLLAFLLCAVLALSACTMAAAQPADGVYEGSAQGMNDLITVSVTVEGGKITDVTVLSSNDTPGISDLALNTIPQAIVAAGSTDVDAASGATFTSKGIIGAVENALSGGAGEASGEFELSFEPDVIVIGAGMSGMIAAIRSAELGAHVLVLEQSGNVGGSANSAGGSISGAGYEVQKKAGIEDTPDLFYGDFIRLGGEENINTEIARAHAERSGAAVDWLYTDIGVNFGDETVDTGVYEPMYPNRVTYANGMVNPPGGFLGFVTPIAARLDQDIAKGLIQLELNTLVTDIILEDGVVTGVMIGDRAIPAPSTIIATGGYGHSEEWLKKYNYTNITSNDPVTAIGSGYTFAEKAGAVFDNMDYMACYGGAVPCDGFEHTTNFGITTHLAYIYPGIVFTDIDGNRLTDEMAYSALNYDQTWTNAKENTVYIYISEGMLDPQQIIMSGPLGFEFENNGWDTFYQMVEEGKYILKADTIEELAETLGMENLVSTFQTYNADCAAGKDSVFGRTEYLIPFEEGPFYAVKTYPYCLMTSGGPRINADAQMVREDGSVIEGAYLCGEIIGSANIGGHATIGGIGHGMNVTWGLTAAQNAVANALK